MAFKTCKYHLVNAKTRQKIFEQKILDLHNLAPRQTVCTPRGANLPDQRTYRTPILWYPPMTKGYNPEIQDGYSLKTKNG